MADAALTFSIIDDDGIMFVLCKNIHSAGKNEKKSTKKLESL